MQNHLFWTGRSGRRAIEAPFPRRLLENEENEGIAAVDDRRRDLENSAAYTDDPDGQTIAGATDHEEINGAHGSNVLV
jgi:hypothetical protein